MLLVVVKKKEVLPPLRWVIEGNRRTIIYVETLAFAHRLLCYFWQESAHSNPAQRHLRFQLCNSICDIEYRNAVHRRFKENPICQVLIATDAAKVGNDWPTIADVVVINPKDPNDVIQKAGRAGRLQGATSSPRALLYFSKTNMEKADKFRTQPSESGKKGKSSGEKDQWLTDDMVRIMTGLCLTAEINKIYDNPIDTRPSAASRTSLPSTTVSRRAPATRRLPGMVSLTKKDVADVREAIMEWQDTLWSSSSDIKILNMPPRSLLPTAVVDRLANNLMNISHSDVKLLLQDQCIHPLRTQHEALHLLICKLRDQFSASASPIDPTVPSGSKVGNRSAYEFPASAYDLFMANLRQPNTSPLTAQPPCQSPVINPPPPSPPSPCFRSDQVADTAHLLEAQTARSSSGAASSIKAS
ncbi:hypothetical protein ONZ45_g14563 [Pleurotus djamor]|nr:hypothetical protein ONZ45_g14563 [Pleurotus djamor]